MITACRNKLALNEIVSKTKLEQAHIIKVINAFIAEGLMRQFTSLEDDKAHVKPLEKPKMENLPKEFSSKIDQESEVDKLLERLESILIVRLPAKKAGKFIEELRACSSEDELRAKARSISKKITLIVNASVGKELLSLLDY